MLATVVVVRLQRVRLFHRVCVAVQIPRVRAAVGGAAAELLRLIHPSLHPSCLLRQGNRAHDWEHPAVGNFGCCTC